MFGTAIIVFREVVEAALIVSIVMASCRGLAGRGLWVLAGIGAGLIGATIVAASASAIAEAVSGIGQEVFNAGVLFLAVMMLGWHNIWMASHGREIAKETGALGRDVAAGARPLYAVAVVTGLAVLREGSETVLFVYGIMTSGGETVAQMMAGGVIGLVAGVGLGVLLYFGLLRIPMSHLFTVTNWMVLFLAAGMAAQCAGFLAQADLVPSLGNALWDTSAILSESSIFGKILHTLTGYVARPSGIQLLFYAVTLLTIGLLMETIGKRKDDQSTRRNAPSATALVIGLGIAALEFGFPPPAHAEFQVRAPAVTWREFEIEHNGSASFGDRRSGQSLTNEIEYGVTPWWKLGIEGEWAAEPHEKLRYEATTLESIFQLTETGRYWADLGFFAEYSHPADGDDASSVKFGPIVRKELPALLGVRSLHTVNLFFAQEIGRRRTSSETEMSYAWQSRFLLSPYFEPGFEAYGEIANAGNPEPLHEQPHRIGPMFAGRVAFPPLGHIRYELGYLFALTHSAEQGVLRWKLEYEIAF